MKKFKIFSNFSRQRGAIGLYYGFSCEIEARDEKDALDKIYQTREFLVTPQIKEIKK